MTFASSDGHQTSVSAILRALIDTKAGGAYSGVITGGNARAVSPAQTFSYAFDVPKNKEDLDVSLTLASDPNNIVDVVLIDPNGELADVGSNLTLRFDRYPEPRPERPAVRRRPAGRSMASGRGGAEPGQRRRDLPGLPRSGQLRQPADPDDRLAQLSEQGAEGRATGDGDGARTQHRRAGVSRSVPTRD